MEHIPFSSSGRAAGDLTHPVGDAAVPEVAAEPEVLIDKVSGGERMNTVREDAEGSVHFLNFTSSKPAVLLARAWHVSGIPFAFEHQAIYREVAAASNCSLVLIDRAEGGGIEHLVFAARIEGLSDEKYLDCIESPLVILT
jgi:hypothetical protein